MARFLQKRKFRLVTRWKVVLKQNIGSRLPSQSPLPHALIFPAFDEIMHGLKSGAPDAMDGRESILAGLAEDARPSADEFMELFLSGRDVLGEFARGDASFREAFPAADRQSMGEALEQAFRQLIDREMREYARRFGSPVSR